MVKFILVFFTIIIFVSCSKETYTYSGNEYEVYFSASKETNGIKALDLSNNHQEIDGKVYELKSLEYLNLSDKAILNLDPKICTFPSLKVLLLNENEGIELPPCLFEMQSLEVLSLIACRYKKLPEGLYKMTNLKRLAIMGNYFTEKDLKRLKESLPNTKIIAYLD